MFGNLSGNQGDRCTVCGGNKNLQVVALDWHGYMCKSLPNVECHACNGRGYVMTAARAAAAPLPKQKQ